MSLLNALLLLSLTVGITLQHQKKSPLKVHLATWNVGESKPPSSLESLLGVDISALPDIVVLGTQEAGKVLKDWSKRLDTLLSAKGYFHVKTVEMDFIQLSVFALNEHKDDVVALKDLSVDFHKGDLKGIGRKKGANILHLTAYGSDMCIINTHLEADCVASITKLRVCPFGQDTYKKRVEQFNKANKKRLTVCNAEDDFTFWLGDLNFRLNGKFSGSDLAALKGDGFQSFLTKDQLNQARQNGDAFKEFKEKEVDFRPTYKFTTENTYKDNRTPAWTDRILYIAQKDNSLDVETYTSLPEYTTSDHKPVVARYSLNID